MDIRTGIIEAAQALGMSPIDLATIMSYETGGTMNPTQPGPTTRWGQHRGFIQFGEQQAQDYGVDWNNPVDSQLGANGAVVKYFQANGWEPGMSFLDAYSIVNAGRPGDYNASDNGGASTVAQKVSSPSMRAHQAKAAQMFDAGADNPNLPSRLDFANAAKPGYTMFDLNLAPTPIAPVVAPPSQAPQLVERFPDASDNPWSSLSTGMASAVRKPSSALPDQGGGAAAPTMVSEFPTSMPAPPQRTSTPQQSTSLSDLFKLPEIGNAAVLNTDAQGLPIRKRQYG